MYVKAQSRIKIHFADPNPDEILHSDIFCNLARIPRFTGSVDYTVGEHSLYVAQLCPPELKLVGLLHDAAEYVFNDLAAPIVAAIPQYRQMRDNFQDVIFKKFLPKETYDMLETTYPIVKEIDQLMYLSERWTFWGDIPRPPKCFQLPINKFNVELALYETFEDLTNGITSRCNPGTEFTDRSAKP